MSLRFALIALIVLAAGCSRSTTPTPVPTPTATPIPVIPLNPTGGAARASGKIVPVQSADLGFASAGRVVSVTIAVGDAVAAGDLLVALDAAAAQAAVAQARAALARAQAGLAELQAGPRAQQVAAAQARLEASQAHLTQLTEGARPDEIAAAQAELDAAQASYDALYAEPDVAVVAAARAQVQQAQAVLDRLLNPATAGQIAEAEAQVRSAQAELDLLMADAREEAVAAAAATVAEAEATLQQAQAALANTELHAPFAGTVASLDVSPGEMVISGQAALTLADLSRLQVETTDLSERDVVRVQIGQPVTVRVDALGQDTPGRVAAIAVQASVIGGDVVYTVHIDLDDPPANLRWGMSADVEILAD
jgi:multidrug efflux pump subunit AcrA (membrane-fusion protein)